jgi:hypothetical protein
LKNKYKKKKEIKAQAPHLILLLFSFLKGADDTSLAMANNVSFAGLYSGHHYGG